MATTPTSRTATIIADGSVNPLYPSNILYPQKGLYPGNLPPSGRTVIIE